MERYRCLSGNVLKWIGIFTMFIDHFGAVLIMKYIKLTFKTEWIDVYWICRYIGRIAFPIFCFTLVEGFTHTRNKGRYIGRMCLFALISEVPFDLAVKGKWFTMDTMNVMATFTLGLLLLWVIQRLIEPIKGKGVNWRSLLRALLTLGVIGAAMAVSELLNMDYGAVGILSILLFYLYRERRIVAAVLGCGALLLTGSTEMWCLLAILPILLYNGTRGRQNKYFFYIFYPGHLFLFGLLAMYVLV